jgi:peptidoglycan-N-acetylglucosamine deacetylase
MAFAPRLTLIVAIIVASPAAAKDCGPGALGTARVMSVGAKGGLQVGLKSYPRTLPLQDHEVILTFDDGPAPATTPLVLDALADQCVRATFFVIGREAEKYPELLRRETAEGQTIAFHTYSHPQPTMRQMSAEAARADITHGIAVVEKAAYGADLSEITADNLASAKLHAPFFRFPGFAETADLHKFLAASNIATFGTDLWAADWIQMTPEIELRAIFSRLDKAGRGMILLHDSKPWTAAMMPAFLSELKKRGYHVVDIVGGAGPGETVPAQKGWRAEAPPY